MVLFSKFFSVCFSNVGLVVMLILVGVICRVIFFFVNCMVCVLLMWWNNVVILIVVRMIFWWFFSFVWCSNVFINVCICVFCVRMLLVKWVIIFGGGFLCKIFVVLWIVVSGFFSLWVNV